MELFTYKAQVISAYDADTIEVSIDLGFDIIFTQKLRFFGINAPEMRGKEKAKGTISRDYLRSRILGKEVIIKTEKDKKGKYGRYLATVFLEEMIQGKLVATNINKELVSKKLAVYKKY